MTSSLLRVLDQFASKRVLVVGDAMLDSYFFGTSTRLCQEAPVPVVAVRERSDHPGGAANTALNLAALGCRVGLLSVVGTDHEGDHVRGLLQRRGVGTELIAVARGRQTLAKQRIVNGGHLVVRVDQGDTGPVEPDVEHWLCARLDAAFVDADAVVISDYGYGVVTQRLLARLGTLQRRFEQVVAVDARDLSRYSSIGVTLVTPNFTEAICLAGTSATHVEPSRVDLAAAIGERVLDRAGARVAAITLDADGAVVLERGKRPFRTYAEPADQSRTAGAGDTYLAALTLTLTTGAATQIAAEIAARAADVVVAQDGTACCSAGELRRAFGAIGAPSSQLTIGPDHREREVASRSVPGRTVVAGEVLTPHGVGEGRGGPGDSTDVGVRRTGALYPA